LMVTTSYKKQEIYSVEAGDYIGQMFVVIDIADDYVCCLTLPNMENISVPKDSFEQGRNTDIIRFIEKLPKDVFKISVAQYKANENTNNRWK